MAWWKDLLGMAASSVKVSNRWVVLTFSMYSFDQLLAVTHQTSRHDDPASVNMCARSELSAMCLCSHAPTQVHQPAMHDSLVNLVVCA